jgi:putative flavoprotein involved in K+ transport
MTMNCVNGIDVDRLRATRDLIEADAPRLYIIGYFVPLSYLREIRLDAGRIARKIGKQLAASDALGRPGPRQALHLAEE